MEQSNAVFSALKAYDDHLWQRMAERPERPESPEIERVPFHLLDKSFLAQQSVRDLLSAERGIARLFSIATDEQKEILAPVSRQIETVLFNKEYMGAQSSQDLMDGKAFLLNEKMHHSEVEFHLKRKPTESNVKALQERMDLIDDAGREKLRNPRASVLLSSTSAARAATPRDEEWVMISLDRGEERPKMSEEERAARKTHLQEARVSRKQERLAYAPHFASLMGVEIDPSKRRIKLGADFQSDEIFRMSIIHGGTPIHGVSSNPKERLEWAQRHVKQLGGSLDKCLFNTVDKYGNKTRSFMELAATAFNAKEFISTVNHMMTKPEEL